MNTNRQTRWILCAGLFGVLLIAGLIGCVTREDGRNVQEADKPIAGQVVPTGGNASVTEVPSPLARGPLGAEDNYYCYVCHLNYDGEELALNHELADVGCATCHGVSSRHSADEDGIIPPEIMYPRGRINFSCMGCHERVYLEPVEAHTALLADPSDEKHACTDCHGQQHRLRVRTRIWDKATGELTWYDGVRMMYEDSPAR